MQYNRCNHCDLYDKKDIIPFDKIEEFIRKNNGSSLNTSAHSFTNLNKSVSISHTSPFAPLP